MIPGVIPHPVSLTVNLTYGPGAIPGSRIGFFGSISVPERVTSSVPPCSRMAWRALVHRFMSTW